MLYFLLVLSETLEKFEEKLPKMSFFKFHWCDLGNSGMGRFSKLVLIAINVDYNLNRMARRNQHLLKMWI